MKKLTLIIIFIVGTLKAQQLYAKSDINYSAVYNKILQLGIKFPDIVFAQSVLESGHYKSRVYSSNNNIFGMRLAKLRKTVATGQNRGYAVYKTWEKSIEDYYLYQNFLFRNKKMERNEYLNHLEKTYSEGYGYKNKLLKIMIKYKNLFNLITPIKEKKDTLNSII
jgi:uncharacterized FlgJ-related protein